MNVLVVKVQYSQMAEENTFAEAEIWTRWKISQNTTKKRLIGEKHMNHTDAVFIMKILIPIMFISGGILFVMQMIMFYNAFGVLPIILSAMLILCCGIAGYVSTAVNK